MRKDLAIRQSLTFSLQTLLISDISLEGSLEIFEGQYMMQLVEEVFIIIKTNASFLNIYNL